MDWESTQGIGTLKTLAICLRHDAHNKSRRLEAANEMNQEVSGDGMSNSIIDGNYRVAMAQQLRKQIPLPPADELRDGCLSCCCS